MLRNRLRLLGGVAVAAVAIVASAGAAAAHIGVNPDTAVQGGDATFAFQVPNEQGNASTTKLQVQLPPGQPLGSVLVKPHPGWTSTVTKTKLATPIKTGDGEVTEAASLITWTATSAANAIKPGQFDEFVVSAGPMPKVPTMQFKTLQTYSDGTVASWIEPEKADGSEPEHPIPTLTLTPAAAEGAAAPAAGSASAAKAASTDLSESSAASQSSVNLALGLSVMALVVALVAAALVMRRRVTAGGQSGS